MRKHDLVEGRCLLGMLLSRRLQPLLAGVILTTGLGACGLAMDQDAKKPSLSTSYAEPRVLGVAIDIAALEHDANYRSIVETTFGSLTPENAMKLDALAPTPEVIRCKSPEGASQQGLTCLAGITSRDGEARNGSAVSLVLHTEGVTSLRSFAKSHTRRLRGHPIVWFRQIPKWVQELDEDSLRWFYGEYTRSVVTEFSSDVSQWDVVNEAILQSGLFRPSVWFAVLGPAHIEQAFRTAAVYSNARLFYNDFDLAVNERKLRAVLWLLDSLRENGVRIDGVGFQMHLRPSATPSQAQLERAFSMVSERGYDIEITELDVALPLPVSKESLAAQAETVCMVISTCRATPRCRGISVWGVSDAHSWIPQILPGLGAATLFDEEYRPKPAYFGLVDALHGEACGGSATHGVCTGSE